MAQQPDFIGAVVDCLSDQIAVLDQVGQIRYVNRSWVQFGLENGQKIEHSWVGRNYLDVCRSDFAQHTNPSTEIPYTGILSVLSGQQASFNYEYPCDSPCEARWFMMRVCPLQKTSEPLFVISHTDITSRKLIEQQARAEALQDPLTQLANRRYFESALQIEWQRGLRDHTPLCLVMLDLDHFKAYNDAHGHLAGDAYLQQVGAILKRYARRPSDLAARFGGEEFVLVLGDTDQYAAEVIAENIRQDINQCIPLNDVNPGSVSAGVACTIPMATQRPEDLLSMADSALYRAKAAGRNQVVLQTCEVAPETQLACCQNRVCYLRKFTDPSTA